MFKFQKIIKEEPLIRITTNLIEYYRRRGKQHRIRKKIAQLFFSKDNIKENTFHAYESLQLL